MKIVFARWMPLGITLACLMSVLGGLCGIPDPVPLLADHDPTTSLTVTKYAADGVTVLKQIIISATDMAAGSAKGSDGEMHTLPIQGDGVLHYFTQGPTFDPDNLWDPDETENLKDKGAPMGTDVKDLCELVGGAASGDAIQICAADDYGNTMFPYANVYNPVPKQGKMVICWYNKDPGGDDAVPGGYVPAWTNGMLLVFFAETTNAAGQHVFGHKDMYDCLPEECRHYYYQDDIKYPSTNGGYIKWVDEINIFTDAPPSWNTDLHGAAEYTMGQAWFENALSCHMTATYNDSQGNVWSGLPLWYVCGLVDDNNFHGPNAFNDNLYYDIKVTGGAMNSSYVLPSTLVERDDSIILANKLNGQAFSAYNHPEYYPLKLVSPYFTDGAASINQVKRIDLLNIRDVPPAEIPTPTPGIADWPLQLRGALDRNMNKGQFQACIQCHESESYTDDAGTWSGLPLWKLVSQADDKNKHGAGSFNGALAMKNYAIKVYAADNSSCTYSSADVKWNDSIIVANKLNGEDLPESDIELDPEESYLAGPLKITGPYLPESSRIGAIVKIELILSDVPAWDLNYDLKCDVGDLVVLGLQWGKTGTAGWIDEDLNNDGMINVGDVVVMGRHWGENW